MRSSWLLMAAVGGVRNALRSSIRRRSRNRYASTEYAMNIFRSLVGDENPGPTHIIRRGEMLPFAVMPIGWKRKNFEKASSVLSILRAKWDRRRLCARKRFGGAVIAR